MNVIYKIMLSIQAIGKSNACDFVPRHVIQGIRDDFKENQFITKQFDPNYNSLVSDTRNYGNYTAVFMINYDKGKQVFMIKGKKNFCEIPASEINTFVGKGGGRRRRSRKASKKRRKTRRHRKSRRHH